MSMRNLKRRLSGVRLHPNVYRLIIGAAALYLLFLLVVNLVRFARSTTDENIFRDPPSRVYVTRAFPVLERLGPRGTSPDELVRDSVDVGDLLISLNGESVTPARIDSLLGTFAGADTVRLDVFRTPEDRVLTFRALRSAIPTDCFQPLPSSVYVMDVAEGGVSDLAGMKKGDLILRINGKTFSNAFEADAVLRSGQSGDTVAYDILRHGEHITLPVTLASFGIQFAFLVVFVTGLAYWGTGTFIALSRPGAAGARLVGLAFICMGFLIGDMFLQRGSPSGGFETLRAATRALTLVLALTFWLHGKFYFPLKRPELLAQRWAIHALYLFTGVALLLLALGIAGYLPGTVWFQVVFLAMLLGMVGVTFWVHWRFRKYRSREYARIRKLLRVAGFSAGIGAAGVAWYLVATKQFFQVGYVGLPLLFIPLSHLYLIGRYQLLDLRLRVRRNILYLVVTSVWIVVGIVTLARILLYLPTIYFQLPNLRFTGTSVVALETPPDPAQQEFFEKLVLIALSLVLTFVFVKIIKLGQRVIDRKFYRAQHNYNRAANELTEVMATRLEMNALAEGLVQKLA
ncbi:MAG: PDZ domain-containing protein, partial [Calditrichaeota bacterium]